MEQLYAIFDGHRGSEAAEIAAINVGKVLEAMLNKYKDTDQALYSTFERLEQIILDSQTEVPYFNNFSQSLGLGTLSVLQCCHLVNMPLCLGGMYSFGSSGAAWSTLGGKCRRFTCSFMQVLQLEPILTVAPSIPTVAYSSPISP